jgi:hypothetical protein
MTPKRKILKRRAKKIDITYRAPNRRKPTTQSSKSARNTFADDGINKDIDRFSDNDEIKNEKTYLCGFKVSKDYIDIINTVISCDLKVIIVFIRDML